MGDEIVQRVSRMYAAIGETLETDMTQFPAHVVRTDKWQFVLQDFSGNKSPEQLANVLHTLIALVASLEYHLGRWAHHNGHDQKRVTAAFKSSRPLQLIHDLWNAEKHGHPVRNDRSGIAPELKDIRRVMQLRTRPKKGSTVIMTMGSGGIPVIAGDGSAVAVVTGDVVASDGTNAGDAHALLTEAIATCETLMRSFGIQIASDLADSN